MAGCDSDWLLLLLLHPMPLRWQKYRRAIIWIDHDIRCWIFLNLFSHTNLADCDESEGIDGNNDCDSRWNEQIEFHEFAWAHCTYVMFEAFRHSDKLYEYTKSFVFPICKFTSFGISQAVDHSIQLKENIWNSAMNFIEKLTPYRGYKRSSGK